MFFCSVCVFVVRCSLLYLPSGLVYTSGDALCMCSPPPSTLLQPRPLTPTPFPLSYCLSPATPPAPALLPPRCCPPIWPGLLSWFPFPPQIVPRVFVGLRASGGDRGHVLLLRFARLQGATQLPGRETFVGRSAVFVSCMRIHLIRIVHKCADFTVRYQYSSCVCVAL